MIQRMPQLPSENGFGPVLVALYVRLRMSSRPLFRGSITSTAQEKKGLPTSPALSGQSPFLPSFDHTTKASRILSRVAM